MEFSTVLSTALITAVRYAVIAAGAKLAQHFPVLNLLGIPRTETVMRCCLRTIGIFNTVITIYVTNAVVYDRPPSNDSQQTTGVLILDHVSSVHTITGVNESSD